MASSVGDSLFALVMSPRGRSSCRSPGIACAVTKSAKARMSDSGTQGTGAVTGPSDVTASTIGSFGANCAKLCPDGMTSTLGERLRRNPSSSTISTGAIRASRVPRSGSCVSFGISRSSAKRLALAIITSSAPAARCFQVPLPGRSRSKASDTRLIVDTRRPRPVSSTTRRRTSSDFSRHSPTKLKALITTILFFTADAAAQPRQQTLWRRLPPQSASARNRSKPSSDRKTSGSPGSVRRHEAQRNDEPNRALRNARTSNRSKHP